MKKSDAVHIINEVIQNGNARSSYELAAQALEKLLEAGMQPPRHKTSESIIPYIKDNNDQGMDFDTEDYMIYRNQWESE